MVLTTSQAKLQVGDKAPNFNLEGIDGKIYSLDDFASYEGMFLVFICNHCPYVQAKIAAIAQLHGKFMDEIAVVGINSNDPAYPGEGMENMKKFAKERGIKFPYLLDSTQEIAKAYGATCTPDPFLFNKERELVSHGRINNALEPGDIPTEQTMEINIQRMLDGETIEKPFEPSMGCSIKWIFSEK